MPGFELNCSTAWLAQLLELVFIGIFFLGGGGVIGKHNICHLKLIQIAVVSVLWLSSVKSG